MLDNERYVLAKKAMVNLSFHSKYGPPDETTFLGILSEHWQTQISLRKIDYESNAKLFQIKDIDRIFLPKRITKGERLTVVHLIGMPRAGKSSVLKNVFQPIEEKSQMALQVAPESSGVLKVLHQKRDKNIDFAELVISQVMAGIVDTMIASRGVPSRVPARIFITDRGLIDLIPFTRANFLSGRLNYSKFRAAIKNIEEGYKSISEYNNAVIMLLVPPKISYDRESPEERNGRVMNIGFLTQLYEQYLRFHQEIVEEHHAKSPDTTFSYACLDMSGDIDSNYRKIAETFGKLIAPFYRK